MHIAYKMELNTQFYDSFMMMTFLKMNIDDGNGYDTNLMSYSDNANDEVKNEAYILQDLSWPTNASVTKDKLLPVVHKVGPVLMAQVWTSVGLPRPKDYVNIARFGC